MKMTDMFVAAACLVTSAGFVQAQRTPPTPAEMAQHEVQRYMALLSLTSAQQAEALTIFTTEVTSAEPLRASERTLHATLETAITGGDTASISQAATSLGQLNGEMLSLRSTAESQLYQLLTADQRTRFSALERAHMQGGGPGGPGGSDGPPQ